MRIKKGEKFFVIYLFIYFIFSMYIQGIHDNEGYLNIVVDCQIIVNLCKKKKRRKKWRIIRTRLI